MALILTTNGAQPRHALAYETGDLRSKKRQRPIDKWFMLDYRNRQQILAERPFRMRLAIAKLAPIRLVGFQPVKPNALSTLTY